MVQFFGPENGHVFGTENVQRCAPELACPITSGTEFRGACGHVRLPPAR